MGAGLALPVFYFTFVLDIVPRHGATVVAADRGVPVVYLESDGPAKSAFLALADAIAEAADNSLEALSSPNS